MNTANHLPVVGKGTDTAVYAAAGMESLLTVRKEMGVIEPGHSAWTPSFNLEKNSVKYIIHTVGTRYIDGSNGEVQEDMFMKKGLTEIVFILDESGSMNGLEADTIGGYNSFRRWGKHG